MELIFAICMLSSPMECKTVEFENKDALIQECAVKAFSYITTELEEGFYAKGFLCKPVEKGA